MGCGQKAVHDDEDDWYAFKFKANIEDVKWDCYSTNANYSKFGYNQHKFKGTLLKDFVTLMNNRDTLVQLEKIEQKERELYEKLKAKFEK